MWFGHKNSRGRYYGGRSRKGYGGGRTTGTTGLGKFFGGSHKKKNYHGGGYKKSCKKSYKGGGGRHKGGSWKNDTQIKTKTILTDQHYSYRQLPHTVSIALSRLPLFSLLKAREWPTLHAFALVHVLSFAQLEATTFSCRLY